MVHTQYEILKAWNFEKKEGITSDYLYFVGGKDSIDRGCVDWGSVKSHEFRFIGDCAGEIRITYENGVMDCIPLIYGYTIWWEMPWAIGKAPFDAEGEAKELLMATLFLKRAYEGNYPYILRIGLRNYPIVKVEAYNNVLKDGLWLEESLVFDMPDPEGFFEDHTIASDNPYPDEIKRDIQALRHLLYTFEADYAAVDAIDIPEGYTGTSILFKGGPEANIISSVFHHNLEDQIGRIDEKGLVHESVANAPTWFYNGLGTWADNYHSYYGKYFTRNKTLQNLAELNQTALCNRVLSFLDQALMFFPDNYPELQIKGQRIPGHWTVAASDPLWYSRELAGIGWPTRYTLEEFGEHHKDYGNPETDGHGLSMMAHWKTWIKLGRPKNWVEERWAYLVEAAGFILWSMEHPELSFSSDGLLYGETEAAMSDYSMYCNIPCFLGLHMYSEMAEAIGKVDQAEAWRKCASGIETAVERYFAQEDPMYGSVWVEEPWGGTISFFHDYYGYDVMGCLPEKWCRRYVNSHKRYKGQKTDRFFVSGGLGYFHCACAQSSLLTDHMADVSGWMKNLARLCYSPRLPRPYIEPECACVDIENGVIGRRGDLGNGYQQAEVLNTILMLCRH